MKSDFTKHQTNSAAPKTTLYEEIPQGLTEHIIIINVNEKLPEVIQQIHKGWSNDKPMDIVIFVQDKGLWAQHPSWHPQTDTPNRIYIVHGCPGNTKELKCAGIGTCRTAVILADPTQGNLSDAKGTLIALAIEKLKPDVHTLIEVVTSGHREHLMGTEVNEVVCMGELTEALLAQSVISPGVITTIDALLSESTGAPCFMAEQVPDEMLGMTYRDAVLKTIENEMPKVICGYIKGAVKVGNRILIHAPVINPNEAQKLEPLELGDAFVIAQ
jgi:hypothetical protein